MSPCCARMYTMNSWNELLVQAARAAVHGDIRTALCACRGSCAVLPLTLVMLSLGGTKPRTPARRVPGTRGAIALRLRPREAPAAFPSQPTQGKLAANSTASMRLAPSRYLTSWSNNEWRKSLGTSQPRAPHVYLGDV